MSTLIYQVTICDKCKQECDHEEGVSQAPNWTKIKYEYVTYFSKDSLLTPKWSTCKFDYCPSCVETYEMGDLLKASIEGASNE